MHRPVPRYWKQPPRKKSSKQAKPQTLHILDQFSAEDIKRWEEKRDHLLQYEWDFLNEFIYRRAVILSNIHNALLSGAQHNYKFSKWQRIVKYKWSDQPLSSQGSLTDPGGRFNIGDIDATKFASFSTLYISSDHDTAQREALAQPSQKSGLDAYDLSLTNPPSFTSVSVSGSLESVIDLSRHEGLKPFIELIKDFQIPEKFIKTAKWLKIPEPTMIRTVDQLIKSLLEPDWRRMPMQFDVPAPSQIFGQLVSGSGIAGILYPSKFTGKDCLAIFPQNFKDSDSFVQLDDPAPSSKVVSRLDQSSWKKLC